jgi:hypothetical protein
MPNLMLGFMAKEAAKARFRSFHITLVATTPSAGSPGTDTAQPTGHQIMTSTSGAGASASFAERAAGSSGSSGLPATGTPMPLPPALFRAASNSRADVDNQKSAHDLYTALFDGVIDAIEFGFNLYRQSAGLVDVQIQAVTAIGGRLQGPALDGLIARAPSVAGWLGLKAVVRDAVAKGMERQWSALANSVTVPGLPWYPTFAAFPAPMAPPTPNIPTPFIALPHDAMATSVQNLKAAMCSALHGSVAYHTEFFDSIATGLQLSLQMWKASQMVALVMGKGPIPTFAPPYVPVGPVVGGTILPGPHINL